MEQCSNAFGHLAFASLISLRLSRSLFAFVSLSFPLFARSFLLKRNLFLLGVQCNTYSCICVVVTVPSSFLLGDR